jgi:hypothetical protein
MLGQKPVDEYLLDYIVLHQVAILKMATKYGHYGSDARIPKKLGECLDNGDNHVL